MNKNDRHNRDIDNLVQTIIQCHDDAVELYTPSAEDLCHRHATENEVEHFLDGLFSYAMDNRILVLFKKVCRHYFYEYPQMIHDYVIIYHEMYEPEKLEQR